MCFRPPSAGNGPVECPKCGAQVDPNLDACPSCGAKADAPAAGMPKPPAPKPPAPKAPKA